MRIDLSKLMISLWPAGGGETQQKRKPRPRRVPAGTACHIDVYNRLYNLHVYVWQLLRWDRRVREEIVQLLFSSHPDLVAIENFERSGGIDKIPERFATSVNDSRVKQIAIPSILQFRGTSGALYY